LKLLLIAVARQVSEGGEVIGLIVGAGDLTEQGNELIAYGADRVVAAVNDQLETYTSESA
jgi:electron transfer flavoprotein alpha subunit